MIIKLKLDKIYSYQANLRTYRGRKMFNKKYINMRNDMINQIKEQMKGQKFSNYCEVGYDFYFTMPKDKKRCQEIATSGMWHSKTDYDNLVKGTQDALEQAGAITDDKILVKHLGGVNKYHTEPYNTIIITINEIKEQEEPTQIHDQS